MAIKDYKFKYGKGTVIAKLESDLVLDELKMKEMPVPVDSINEIRKAINNPIGCRPFKENFKSGDTVAFIVNDSTRVANSTEFLPVMFNELNSMGIPDDKIFIIFALGAHRPMTVEEMSHEVGMETASRVRLYCGDCLDKAQFTYFGETSFGTPVYFHNLVANADHIIATGSVLHHYLAGFGGGRKAMLPGVAYYETIRHNHSMIFDENSIMGKLKGNPVYDDQIEAVEMCRPTFLVNVVLNGNMDTLKVFAGDYIEAHFEACRFVDEVYGVDIEEKADLVIVSSGGYPKDIDVYQLHKTMINARSAVKDGGIVIILGECRDGSGSKTYEDIMRKFKTPEKVEAETRKNFQVGAHKAYGVTSLMKDVDFILVSELDDDLAKLLLFTPAKDIDAALEIAFHKLGSNPSIITMTQGSFTVPNLIVKAKY
jgi:nickel-dependent lactate racemase